MNLKINFTIFFLCSIYYLYSQATFSENPTPLQLLNALEGDNINLTNPVILSGVGSQFGIFSNGVAGANLLIDTVVAISTGTISETFSSNSSSGISLGPGTTYNDADLTAINANAIYDVAILEFDFQLLNGADGVKINFQFASDEYPEYVCSQFNDVFGFFVQENSTGAYENIAIVPTTGNAVAVNSINAGAGSSGTSGTNNCDETQSALYIDNTSNAIFSEYDGFTVNLSAKKLLPTNQIHKIKIAIADAFDGGWDSAVFLNFVGGFYDCDADGIEDEDEIAGEECDACKPNPTANCDGDCDNDGVTNCIDAAPIDACIPNTLADCAGDCDNDGVSNCIDCDSDNAVINYAEGYSCLMPNGAFAFIDENCNCVCDVTIPNLDCDNDGTINLLDCEKLNNQITSKINKCNNTVIFDFGN